MFFVFSDSSYSGQTANEVQSRTARGRAAKAALKTVSKKEKPMLMRSSHEVSAPRLRVWLLLFLRRMRRQRR